MTLVSREELHGELKCVLRKELSDLLASIKECLRDEMQSLKSVSFGTSSLGPATQTLTPAMQTLTVADVAGLETSLPGAISEPDLTETPKMPLNLPEAREVTEGNQSERSLQVVEGRRKAKTAEGYLCFASSHDQGVAGRDASSSAPCVNGKNAHDQVHDLNLDEAMFAITKAIPDWQAGKRRIKAIQALIPNSTDLSRELKQLGYFRKAEAPQHVQESPSKGTGHEKISGKSSLMDCPLHPNAGSDWVSEQSGCGPAMSAKANMLRAEENPEFANILATPQEKASKQDPRELRKASRVGRLVSSQRFEQGVLVFILLNAIFVGAATEDISSQIRTGVYRQHDWVYIIEVFFFLVFAIELGLRFYVFRGEFFSFHKASGKRNKRLLWNVLDSFLVLHAAAHIATDWIIEEQRLHVRNSGILRFLRVLRVGRMFRIAKLLRFFKSMRVMATAIGNSIGLFAWAILALALVTYMFAVYYTEIVCTHLMDQIGGNFDQELDNLFGSLWNSWFSLLKAATGGADWGDIAEPLKNVGFTVAFFPFIAYLLFILIVVMNVFTGIFLESASEKAKQETEVMLLRSAYEIFSECDSDKTGRISKSDFRASLKLPDVHSFFQAINLDIEQAEVLFELLDISNDGIISRDEFLRGCLRLRGTAKALDLLILSREVNQLASGILDMIKANSLSVQVCQKTLGEERVITQDIHKLLREVMQEREVFAKHQKVSKDNNRLLTTLLESLNSKTAVSQDNNRLLEQLLLDLREKTSVSQENHILLEQIASKQ